MILVFGLKDEFLGALFLLGGSTFSEAMRSPRSRINRDLTSRRLARLVAFD